MKNIKKVGVSVTLCASSTFANSGKQHSTTGHLALSPTPLGVGPADLLRSFPTPPVLWFCDMPVPSIASTPP